MNFYEECLTLGQWLDQDERRALYKFFVSTKNKQYVDDAKLLIRTSELKKTIANGEIVYELIDGKVTYKAREKGSELFTNNIREMHLNKFRIGNIKKLIKFFAQCEVDVIHNFPLPGVNPQEEGGMNIDANPYYGLSYYANGKSKFVGLINKIKTDDSELLKKLSA